jgi:hypothetical protein
MKFWNFFNKSNKEVDEALYKCAESYKEFQEYIHQGHFQSFTEFKIRFQKESHYIRKEIVDCKDNSLKLLLINYLQNQLDYFNDNHFGPYAAKVDLDKFEVFIANNYPYKEKVDKIKVDYLANSKKNEKFLKQGFDKLIDIIDAQTNQPSPFSSGNLNNKKNRLK